MNDFKSQNVEIVTHLKKGRTITCLQAWKLFGCSALHSRISEIRHDMNLPVHGERIKVKTSRGMKSVMKYSLNKD